MTIRQHRDEPCWEIVRVATGQPPEAEFGDGWPHYATMAEAQTDLAERQADYDDPLTVARSFPGPCVGLFCDGHGCADAGPIDCSGEGWMHLDPTDPTPFNLDDVGVHEQADKHYCDDCWYSFPECDECDDRHPGGCPAERVPSPLCTGPDGSVLDVPLFSAGGAS